MGRFRFCISTLRRSLYPPLSVEQLFDRQQRMVIGNSLELGVEFGIDGFGSGGGISSTYAIPSWQQISA